MIALLSAAQLEGRVLFAHRGKGKRAIAHKTRFPSSAGARVRVHGVGRPACLGKHAHGGFPVDAKHLGIGRQHGEM
jgi:hypothetical protein